MPGRRPSAEHQASLHAIDRMQDLGYYPKPPQIIARRLSPSEAERLRRGGDQASLFIIEEMQFRVGLFSNIEKAAANPGEEFDKAGKYIIQRNYTTSQALNAYLGSGTKTFPVERRGEVYEMAISEPANARRPSEP